MAQYQYEVTVANTFEADSPEQAARQMIEWLQDSDPWSISYRVQRQHQDAIDYIDADDLDPMEPGSPINLNPDTDKDEGRRINPATWQPYEENK
jgi:hypothetical protein